MEDAKKPTFHLLSSLSLLLKKLRNSLLKIDLVISQHAELRLICFYDMLNSLYRWTFCIIKVSGSSVSTRVMSIFKVCLLLPTLVNKSWDILCFLVWRSFCHGFHGCTPNLSLWEWKMRNLWPFQKPIKSARKWVQNFDWPLHTQGTICDGTYHNIIYPPEGGLPLCGHISVLSWLQKCTKTMSLTNNNS